MQLETRYAKSDRCPSCRHVNRPERRCCAECGVCLGQACAACEARSGPGEQLCGNCSNPLSGTAPAAHSHRTTERTEAGARGGPEAARRHLTVVIFCDVVASTALSRRINHEDLRQPKALPEELG